MICRGIVKHVTEASEEDGDEHDDADTCSTTGNLRRQTLLKRNNRHHRRRRELLFLLASDNGYRFLRRKTGITIAMPTAYQNQCVESYVMKGDFAKLTDPQAGKHFTLSTVAWSPLWA